MQTRLLDILPLDNLASRDYHSQLEFLTFDQVRGSPLNVVLQRVDNRLFTAVHGSCRAPSQEKYAIRIQVECELGNGRQAIKVLDVAFGYEASRLAEVGADALPNMVCKTMEELQEYCSRIRLGIVRIRASTGAPLPEVLVVPQIKRAIENINEVDVSVALSTFGALPINQRSSDLLIDVLEFQASQYKTKQDRLKARPKALTALGFTPSLGADGRPFTGKCRWCQNTGHKMADCKQKAAGKPKRKATPKKKPDGAGGGADNGGGNGKDGKPPRTPCEHCGKTNHRSDKCW